MSQNEINLHFRPAIAADSPRIRLLIEASVRGLGPQAYSQSQIEHALGTWLGLDTQLILDGTYFVVEAPAAVPQLLYPGEKDPPALVACGGWSRRKTPFGGDARPGRDDALLDPRTDAAKIRAFFVHPAWTRRGIGSRLLELCEQAARAEGFSWGEMGATLTGVPLYRHHGYAEVGRIDLPLANGEVLPIVTMTKHL
jgi:GNAT superfamily N-acetyltransferase